MPARFLPALWILACGGLLAAQEPPAPASPLPNDAEFREILKKSVDEDNLRFEPSRDYIYVEDKAFRQVDGHGKTLRTNSKTYERIVVYGEEYERLIRKNGRPLSPGQTRAEQEKLDRETEKRKQEPAAARAGRLETANRRNSVCNTEFVEGFTFRLLGADTVGGRPAWKVEAVPIPGGSPACKDVGTIKKFRLLIWIDQAEGKWSRFQADNVDAVSFGAVLARAPAGSLHVKIELTRRDDGAWLPERVELRRNVKALLMMTVHDEFDYTYSQYRKFQSESRMVE